LEGDYIPFITVKEIAFCSSKAIFFSMMIDDSNCWNSLTCAKSMAWLICKSS